MGRGGGGPGGGYRGYTCLAERDIEAREARGRLSIELDHSGPETAVLDQNSCFGQFLGPRGRISIDLAQNGQKRAISDQTGHFCPNWSNSMLKGL